MRIGLTNFLEIKSCEKNEWVFWFRIKILNLYKIKLPFMSKEKSVKKEAKKPATKSIKEKRDEKKAKKASKSQQ